MESIRRFPSLLALAALLSSACISPQVVKKPTAQALLAPVSGPEIQLPEARSAIEKLLAGSGFRQDTFAVSVVSVPEEIPFLSFNETQPMMPASNAKLATTAAALSILGPDYRFKTDVGVHEGALYIKGGGDPTLDVLHLKEMARAVVAGKNATGLNGTVVLDASGFKEYEQINADFNRSGGFNTALGPLSVDHNRIVLHLTAGEPDQSGVQKLLVHVTPDPDGFVVSASSKPVGFETHYKPQFEIFWNETRAAHEIIVLGPMQPGSYALAVRRPTDHFGRLFAKALHDEGRDVKELRRGRMPREARLLATHASLPLYEILRRMNLESDNFIAEQLLLALAASRGAGSLEDGATTVSRFLTEKVGLPKGSFRVYNGSGLSRESRFSPTQITRILAYMRKQKPLSSIFESTLPIAGWSGTLRSRLVDPPGLLRISAKTGLIDYVSCMAGYGTDAGGKDFAFSLMFNDAEGLERTKNLRPQDREAEMEWQKTTAINDRFKALQDQILDILSRTRF